MAFKNLRLGSDTSRLILLFVAILPATESKDWLFYTVSVLIIGLFIMHVIYGIKLRIKSEIWKSWAKILIGRRFRQYPQKA